MKKNDCKITTWVLLRDGIMFDGAYDTPEEAEQHRQHNNNCYQGYWKVRGMTDKQFMEMMGITNKIITDPELSRAYGTLIRR
jgi:hypothetical protein